MRILADLPEDDIKWLDRTAAEQGRSRAAVLREAVTSYRAKDRDWLEQGFGLWTRYGQGTDGAEFEERVRDRWQRAVTGGEE